jgi:hypothetical protein
MCREVPAVNKSQLLNRVGTHFPNRLAIAGLALAFGLVSCQGDDTSPNLPPIIPVPNSIAVADLNGAPDLLVATTADEGGALNPGYADVIMNTPGSLGTFQTGVHYSTTGSNPSSIAVADLTGGTGPVDIVIANFGSGSVSVFMQGASGTFNQAVDWPTGGQPNQVVIADVNGDGKPDLVLADLSSSGNVIVLLGDGTGKFGAPMNLSTGSHTTTSVAVADLGNGAPDIVAATYDSSGNNGSVYIFYQDKTTHTINPTPVILAAGPQPQSVKIADLGNGLPDIIVANLGPGADGTGMSGVSVLMQTSLGTFAAPTTFATPGQSIDVAVGNLTGTGMDLVVANLLPANTGSISVLTHGATAGTFGAAANYEALGQPLSVVIHNLSGHTDGRQDIAVADGPSAGVLLQNTDGTFAAETQVGF